MGVYVAFAFVVGTGYLAYLMTRGAWRRFGARWWTAILFGLLSMIPFLLAVNAFTALGGSMTYARLVFFPVLYLMLTTYGKLRDERHAKEQSQDQ